MYTHHEDHDIFVCDICEAIMVTEEAIGDHLKMKHREEIRRTSVKIIPDSERGVEDHSDDADVNEDEVQMEVVLENPKLDSKYVNKQFYVCQKCDDIFLDRRHLQVHVKLSHVVDADIADGPLKDAPKPEHDPPCPTCPTVPTPKKKKVNNENNYRTVRQGPSNTQSQMSSKSLFRLIKSPLKENNVNLVNTKKNAEVKGNKSKETLLNKLSDSNGEPIEIYLVSKGVDSPPKSKRSPQIKEHLESRLASKKNTKKKAKRQGPPNTQLQMSSKSLFHLIKSPLKEKNVNLVNTNKNAEVKGVDSPPKAKKSPQIKEQSESKDASKKNTKKKGRPSVEKNINNKISEKRNLIHVLSKESAGKAKKSKLTSVKSPSGSPQKTVLKEYQCSTCGKINSGAGMFKNHLLSHHYDKFANLPNGAPYNCPVCPASDIRDRITLIRHYAFTHKKLSEVTGITEEKLKEIVKLSLVPRDQ